MNLKRIIRSILESSGLNAKPTSSTKQKYMYSVKNSIITQAEAKFFRRLETIGGDSRVEQTLFSAKL